jgi:hypothetical protein
MMPQTIQPIKAIAVMHKPLHHAKNISIAPSWTTWLVIQKLVKLKYKLQMTKKSKNMWYNKGSPPPVG